MKRKRAVPSTPKPTTSTKDRRRALRLRPVPRWITGRQDLDEVAQRRCLLVLSVLSGEKAVTTAITELGISRPLYYQLETKALLAMLAALAPGANAASSPDQGTSTYRIADLEDKVTRLEQDKRRLERLLFLTRKVLPAGPVAVPGKRGPRPGSGRRGPRRLPGSTRTATTNPPAASIPRPDGAPTP